MCFHFFLILVIRRRSEFPHGSRKLNKRRLIDDVVGQEYYMPTDPSFCACWSLEVSLVSGLFSFITGRFVLVHWWNLTHVFFDHRNGIWYRLLTKVKSLIFNFCSIKYVVWRLRETKDGCFIMTENDTKGYFLIWKILMVLMISMMLKLKSHQHLQHHWPVSRHLLQLFFKYYIYEI